MRYLANRHTNTRPHKQTQAKTLFPPTPLCLFSAGWVVVEGVVQKVLRKMSSINKLVLFDSPPALKLWLELELHSIYHHLIGCSLFKKKVGHLEGSSVIKVEASN